MCQPDVMYTLAPTAFNFHRALHFQSPDRRMKRVINITPQKLLSAGGAAYDECSYWHRLKQPSFYFYATYHL